MAIKNKIQGEVFLTKNFKDKAKDDLRIYISNY